MADEKAQSHPVTVILLPEPPRLTPAAARALLKILVKAHETQLAEERRLEGEQRDPAESGELELHPEDDELSP